MLIVRRSPSPPAAGDDADFSPLRCCCCVDFLASPLFCDALTSVLILLTLTFELDADFIDFSADFVDAAAAAVLLLRL